MIPFPDHRITLLICSVLEAEVRQLAALHWPESPIIALDSLLHIRPEALAQRLGPAVDAELAAGRRVVLVYGDCFAWMSDLEGRPGVARVAGMNCNSILLGRDECRALLKVGAFFLLPEWTTRWREIFTRDLGLNRENARGLMHDAHRKLVYLDTGIVPVPTADLQACAEHCGLPWEILPVSLEPLRAAIAEARARVAAPEVVP